MQRNRSGFSLVELLVVIALIAGLLSLVLVSLAGLRNAANRSDSLGALRQMATAYNAYSTEHDGRFMPGFISRVWVGRLNIHAVLPDGTVLDESSGAGDVCDASSYVWRLAPYLGNAWETYLRDYKSQEYVSFATVQYTNMHYGPGSPPPTGEQWSTFPGIATAPSFGMNSIFVGGDDYHGELTEYSPWNSVGNPAIAATRMSEVKNPSRLIVFGESALAGTGGDTYASESRWGYPELRPPHINPVERTGIGAAGFDYDMREWRVTGEDVLDLTLSGSAPAGLPVRRWGEQFISVNLDGSTSSNDLHEVSSDMRRWSPWAAGMSPPRVP